ncbi:pentatricopeptide repeat-containing protein At1g71420 [Coffea arabica]|uniref:Pentatricopeptide repeat-containing protein At1g71420 n=1 Tax=Coffea arabica TaxID=13443 RepID=A0A6P6XK64_COFAR|nr:pentatricopeptide repeat-containing protein At1g71420-like [Coffea arabica]XP_027127590.1 pentatricopeptide repeat-containing protein At1g71420-like [Coffea arabica]XP_027127591.1 pentatricopeptide repeat-containing protein At1g71420-like [Coffea arabica]XP_027127593.1 pentatricopeptide repeat-containing protein At1g71420-like [Coffea arabica]XP_027127594.1 pentatricopeptide repeat-containing protein At1g71420-like [Coffea arabica]XP_027127595.1 pentatricopeptide repeat-containing protein A
MFLRIRYSFSQWLKPLHSCSYGTFLRTLTTTNSPATPTFDAKFENVSQLEKAISLFYDLSFPPNFSLPYARLFQACARHNRLDLGQDLHHHLLTHETTEDIDLYTTNHLINMSAKCGDLCTAYQMFEKMPHKNIFSWTSLISGYSQHGKVDECFSMFTDMLAHCRPNDFAYTSVLSICDGFKGRQVHGVVVKTGFGAYVYAANALITMYWKSRETGFCRIYSNSEEAWRVFDGMEFRNLVTWNSMIAGFQMLGQCSNAVNFFITMCRDGVGFDRATLVSVLSAFSENSEYEYVSSLKSCFQIHGIVIKAGFKLDVAVVTVLLSAYSILGGEVADCHKLFIETNGCRDVVLWTGIITAFADRKPGEALLLFNLLRTEGLNPDCYAFSIVLKACGGFSNDKHALAVYCLITKVGFTNNVVLQNASIHAFARCGSLSQAAVIFDEMRIRDVVSWNSIIKAFALHGQGKQALDLFKQMDVEPDATTFVALLSACSHSGMVHEGVEIFDTMSNSYGVVPQLDHYACMVDILGQAGHLVQAVKLVREMPMQPDYVVWSALVGACRKHGETQLANFAVSKLRELDPENSLGYVVMSNIHCSTGSFDVASLIRKRMKALGVQKEPGLSWTDIGNQVHEFVSGGGAHPQRETIRTNTKELVGKLKTLGYVPQTSLALHDIEEEHKEEELYYHSEKLALVFTLMSTSDLNCKLDAVRIMKNIRICPDCHNFMKLASQLIQREIVVRDSNRFHNFMKGFCSCNDYW